MPGKTIYCDSCEAVFKINHTMDDEYYKVNHCPFCGEELMTEEELDEWREEMWDEDEEE